MEFLQSENYSHGSPYQTPATGNVLLPNGAGAKGAALVCDREAEEIQREHGLCGQRPGFQN